MSPIEARETFDGRFASHTVEIIVKNIVKRFASDESGATAIEYGLIAAIMGVAVIAIFNTFGQNLKTGFATLGAKLNTEASKTTF